MGSRNFDRTDCTALRRGSRRCKRPRTDNTEPRTGPPRSERATHSVQSSDSQPSPGEMKTAQSPDLGEWFIFFQCSTARRSYRKLLTTRSERETQRPQPPRPPPAANLCRRRLPSFGRVERGRQSLGVPSDQCATSAKSVEPTVHK